MEKSERETVININAADLEEGYFSFGTSEKNHFERLCRRIGGRDKLLSVRESKTRIGNRIVWWECDVPKEFLKMGTFAIGKKQKRNLSDSQRLALQERGKRLNAAVVAQQDTVKVGAETEETIESTLILK